MKTIIDVLQENANNIGDKIAIQTKKESISYKTLWDNVEVLAGYLKTLGIHSGDRVILEAISEPSYVMMYLALQKIGVITAPVERGIKLELLSYLINLLDAKLYISKNESKLKSITCKAYSTTISEATQWNVKVDYERPDGKAISEIIFTTGTTGRPKGAMHSVDGITCNTSNTVNGIGMLPTDRILLPLPLNHSFGMRVLRSALEVGACVVLQSGAVFSDALIGSIEKFDCNAMACVSATMETVLKEIGEEKLSQAFSKLRYIEFSAGAVPKSMREKLVQLLPNTDIHNTWGSSESGGCLFLNVHKHPEKISAVGKALEHITLAIYSDDTESFIEGTGKDVIGRLAIKGEMIFKGYWGQEDIYKQSVKDGWLITNDLVWRDDDDYYYILGRADDVINIGGEKVAPSEIENALFNFEGLNGCACIGVPDKEGVLGEVPLLLYSVKEGSNIDVEKLKQTISAKVGVYKTPKKFVEVVSIPKNYMKKTDYKLLKKLYKEKGEEGFKELTGEINNSGSSRTYDLHNVVVETILNRKSQRKFTDELVPQDIIEMLVEVGKSAPSGKNLQTRRFTVISNQEEIQNLKATIGKVAKTKHTSFNGFENPPLLILISNDRRNKDGIQDVGVSAENIMIACESYGLGSVWLNPLMDISDEPEIREKLDEYTIPSNHIVWAVMSIGYVSEPTPDFYRKPNEVYYIS